MAALWAASKVALLVEKLDHWLAVCSVEQMANWSVVGWAERKVGKKVDWTVQMMVESTVELMVVP